MCSGTVLRGTVPVQPDKWDDNIHLIAFIPKAMINGRILAGLLAHLTFRCLPMRSKTHSGEGSENFHKGLQLRVQLRFLTGFPFHPGQ